MRFNAYLVLMAGSLATALSLSFTCDHVCSIPQAMVNEPIQLLRYRCGCIGHNTATEETATTTIAALPQPQTPGPKRSVASKYYTRTISTLCQILCSIQLGGNACNCNADLVPGK